MGSKETCQRTIGVVAGRALSLSRPMSLLFFNSPNARQSTLGVLPRVHP
jgi:hypothetical protein